MATKIVTKNSSTASAVPTTSDLVQGELAVNVADKRLFTEDNTGTIVELGTNPSTIDIDAGTIDGAVIGGNTPAAITGSTVTSTGNIVVSGTVDGRDVATDGTKLDGIEANADVTDTTNVTAAGALMDSEVTNLAQVKAFDSSDYATAAQGTTADNALPKSGGAMTGAITTNSTFDGRDVGTDGTKLDGIEAGADVTDTTNVTAAGALMDSEVTNLAQVKAFDSSDYATAAQGTTADNALPKSGGALTGPVTTTSTFDGRDVATDGTKLDGIEASADVTDTANVTAAGAVMDSELTSEASVKALNQGVATTDSPSFVNLTLSGTGSVKVPSGTTAQRDGSPANGMFRYNSTNEQFEGYQSGAWGAIGGGGGSNTFTADTFTGDGSTTAYALSQVVNSEDNLLVFIAGVFQQQSAYSIATASGTTTLTFATAPANTREIIVYSVASAVSGTNLNIDSMTGDGSDTTLSLSINPVNENNTQVFIDGVYQNKDTYSISGTTLTFSTAPPTGSAVEVMTMTQTEINVPVDGTMTPAKIASGDFYFDTDTLYIDATNDNVGVGTSTPNTNLGAYNGVSIDATNAALQLQGTNFSSVLFGDSADADVGGVLYDHSSDAMRFYANGSERARILSTGGITFNGDTAQANALDDYEEGTFTAVYVGSTVAGSSPSITSYYTKIGRLVTVTITHNNFTATSASGNLRYTGLPFVASSTGGSHGAVGVSANISSTTLVASVLSGTDYIQVRNANTTVFSTVANASSMYFLTTISYITDL